MTEQQKANAKKSAKKHGRVKPGPVGERQRQQGQGPQGEEQEQRRKGKTRPGKRSRKAQEQDQSKKRYGRPKAGTPRGCRPSS